MIVDLFADYLLALFVVAGLIACTLLGLALGCQGLTIAVRGAHRAGQRARAAVRERDKARGEKALALAQRDDFRRQLDLANAALAQATHPVQHRDDLPEQDPAMDALMRAVTGEGPVDDTPHGAHHRQEDGTWPCESITTDPHYVGYGSPEIQCEETSGHDGRHRGGAGYMDDDGDIEWDDEGTTWVRGERLADITTSQEADDV